MPVQTGAEIANDPALATRALSGNTIWTSDSQHGSQYEYHTSDGRTFLWYPGNKQIVEGAWRIQQSVGSAPKLCYKYGPKSYNPVTKKRGGEWDCWWLQGTVFSGSSTIEGDPFNLQRRDVPFVMERQTYTPPDVVAGRLGIAESTLNFITNMEEL